MNDTKKLGRPRAFDEAQALWAAVNTFWAKGYDGTSIKDLAGAMGINSPSLYATFGDKEALYKRAINCYVTNEACAPLVAFDREPDITDAVRSFMQAAIEYATDQPSGVRGCFLSSCVSTTAGTVDGITDLLHQAVSETDQRLAQRFDAEKTQGTLPADFPSAERARLMFDLRQGHVFRARSGFDSGDMEQDLDHRVRCVLA